jgi:16S rRNA processing protein RimM
MMSDRDGNVSGPGESAPGPQFLVIARVMRPHGVRGDLRLQLLTAFPDRMRDLDQVLLGKDPDDPPSFVTKAVTAMRRDRGYWLAHLEGINDREGASAFSGWYVMVSLADAVPLEPDEVYLFQVIGLEVVTEAGETLGRVAEVIETGANDVYIVRGGPRGEVMIPAIDDVVRSISPETGRMIVRPLPGLLPE